ncbi:hypothetical protein GCM10010381_49680 [Streptomyces xantholiticus]|nr:hypothetical protein GCM10010381_49680 [Streptomyces xantholiticus]
MTSMRPRGRDQEQAATGFDVGACRHGRGREAFGRASETSMRTFRAALSIQSIESVTAGAPGAADDVAVCVVRCIEGTARPGMMFERYGTERTDPRLRGALLL